MIRLPRWAATVVALAVVVLAGATSAPVAGAQQSEPELRVHRRSGGPEGDVSLVVTAPPAVIGAALPASAFTVRQGGQGVPADVTPMGSDGMEVVLVLGARSSASLDAEQGAGAEFLRALSPGVRAGVVDASGPRTLVPLTTDGDRVGQALLDVETASTSEPTSEAAVETALTEFSEDASRRVVLLMTDDDGDVSPALAARLVDAEVSLYYVQAAVQAEPVPTLVDAAEASGGRAQAGDLRGLIRTIDEVRRDLANQYAVRFASTGAGTAEVRVATAGGELEGSADLAAPAPTLPPRQEEASPPPAAAPAEDEGDGAGGTAVLVVLVALLLLAAAVVGALLVLRRRRAAAPPPGPVVLDLREQAAPTTPADEGGSLAGPRGESTA